MEGSSASSHSSAATVNLSARTSIIYFKTPSSYENDIAFNTTLPRSAAHLQCPAADSSTYFTNFLNITKNPHLPFAAYVAAALYFRSSTAMATSRMDIPLDNTMYEYDTAMHQAILQTFRLDENKQHHLRDYSAIEEVHNKFRPQQAAPEKPYWSSKKVATLTFSALAVGASVGALATKICGSKKQ